MQVRATKRGWGGVCLVLWAGIAVAAEPASTVLVTDFQVPSTATWAWARRGLPELAVEALNERGIVTVDRDLLSVVNAEHDLNAGKEDAQGGLQMGQWLGATFLLAGSVETVRVDCIRLSGTLTRVETSEQVGASSVEGDYKKDLHVLIGQWVAGLMKNVEHGIQAAVPEKVNPVKPEALMFFQQGVDACAAGKPALAVGFFLNAHAMDPRLQAAKEWEAHAYELGGLPRYAASVREQTAHASTSSVAVTVLLSATQTVQRVVSVLNPVWLGGANTSLAATSLPTLSALRTTMEEALLTCKGVRLYRPESLSEVVAETDRQLSLQFNPHGAPRYARWLASDGMLYSASSPLANGKIGLEVGLMDALTARNLKHVKREVEPNQMPATLVELTRECVDGWQATTGSQNASCRSLSGKLPPLSEEAVSRLPDYREMVKALDGRMRGTETLNQGQTLTDFYIYEGNIDLAVIELNDVLRKADVHGPGTEAVLASVYWWSKGYSYNSFLACDKGKRTFTSVLDNLSLKQAVGEEGPKRITALRTRLLSEYPSSGGTYAVRHLEAIDALFAEQWKLCLTNAIAAWAALEERSNKGFIGHSSIGDYTGSDATTKMLIHVNCLYLQGAALRQLRDYVQANQCFDKIQQILSQNSTVDPLNFLVPAISFDGNSIVVGFGQLGATSSLAQAILRERDALAIDQDNAQQMELAIAQGGSLATRIKQLSDCQPRNPKEQLKRLQEITRVWNEMPPASHAQCLFAEQAVVSVDGIGDLPAEERLAVVQDLAHAYLRVTGFDPDQLGDNRSLKESSPRIKRIVRYYRSVGLGAESLVWVNRLLTKTSDPAFGRELINNIVDDLADSISLPFVRYNLPLGYVPKNTHWASRIIELSVPPSYARKRLSEITDDVARLMVDCPEESTRCERIHQENTITASIDESHGIFLVKAFFEKHKDIPDISKVQAKFWRRLSLRAASYCAYGAWFNASLNAQACDPNSSILPRHEPYVARLALSSCTQDVLLAAIQMRDKLGPSPNPLPFISWYTAGYLCVEEKEYEQALVAFRILRETYNAADFNDQKYRLDGTDSDQSLRWSLDYLEGVCLAATGHAADAAPRFRQLSQRFGARPIFLQTETSASGGGFASTTPLGLLAAEALHNMHQSEPDKTAHKK